MKLKKKEMFAAIAKMFSLLSEGKGDREIAEAMGIGLEELSFIKAKMFEEKAEEYRGKPIEHTYIEYMIAQLGNVHDLTEMLRDFKKTKQHNAMVGAVRARAEIYDKILVRGQECGVIKKAATVNENLHGLIIADLTNDDLRKQVLKEFAGLKRIAGAYGDADFSTVEVPEKLHYGPTYELPPSEVTDGEEETEKKKKKKKKSKKKRKKMKTTKGE